MLWYSGCAGLKLLLAVAAGEYGDGLSYFRRMLDAEAGEIVPVGDGEHIHLRQRAASDQRQRTEGKEKCFHAHNS